MADKVGGCEVDALGLAARGGEGVCVKGGRGVVTVVRWVWGQVWDVREWQWGVRFSRSA